MQNTASHQTHVERNPLYGQNMQIQLNHVVTYPESDVVDDEDSNMIGGGGKAQRSFCALWHAFRTCAHTCIHTSSGVMMRSLVSPSPRTRKGISQHSHIPREGEKKKSRHSPPLPLFIPFLTPSLIRSPGRSPASKQPAEKKTNP